MDRSLVKLITSFLLPALAVLGAALAQLALTAAMPALRNVGSAPVTVDGYFAVLLMVLLCWFAGRWTGRYVAGTRGLLSASIAPLAWLAVLLWALARGSSRGLHGVAWFSPLTMFFLFSGLAPMLGVGLGWLTADRSRAASVSNV